MAKEFAKAFYTSKEWKKCRAGYIKSVHGLCERCGAAGYIVHHKEVLTPRNINNPDVTLNWNKLEYVCQDCHNKEHNRKYSALREDVMFDKDGNLVRRCMDG